MATVWNPSDVTTNISLSNTNHTATSTGGGNNGVRAVGISHSTGKWYLEFSNILSGGSAGSYGCAAFTDSLGGFAQLGVTPIGQLDAPTGSVTAGTPDGKTLGLAIDLDNELVWATYDGVTWTTVGGPSSPSAGTGGLGLSGIVVPIVPHAYLQNNPGHCTLNCGDSAFVLAVPAGFLGWDAPPPLPPHNQATVVA